MVNCSNELLPVNPISNEIEARLKNRLLSFRIAMLPQDLGLAVNKVIRDDLWNRIEPDFNKQISLRVGRVLAERSRGF